MNLDAEFAEVEGEGGEGVVAAVAGGGKWEIKSNATCPASHSVNTAPPPIPQVEQYRNDIVGDEENNLTSPCRIKKATEKGRPQGATHADAHSADMFTE
jgi:hypothetical protein